MSAYDPEENTGMLSGRSNPKPVMVGRAPQWFYAGVLILGAIALIVIGSESAGLIAPQTPVFAPAAPPAAITVDVNTGGSAGGAAAADEPDFREMFTKKEYMVPMRDGVKLYVATFTPKLKPQELPTPRPMLISRTPYSCAPYGEDQYPAGQSRSELKNYFNEGWIFVRCDVRGRYASEGNFVQVWPL